MSTIKICNGHNDYPVPLIWTFSFIGSEFWCPYCGCHGGMLGTGSNVSSTLELEERAKLFKKYSAEFLHATGIQICAYTTWEGDKVRPDKLPSIEKERLEKIRRDWKYYVKVETVKTD